MAFCAKNQYQIEISEEISKQRILDLFTCYLPCVGYQALSFYLTLLAEAQIHGEHREHTRLCKLTGMDIREIENARIKCEQYSLIKTFVSQDETMYLYEILKPLNASEFLQHDVFGRLYLNNIGSKETEVTSASVFKPRKNSTRFLEISAPFDASLLNHWDAEKEMEYSTVSKELAVEFKTHRGFDMEQFLSLSTNLTFPYQARTQQNLDLISDLGALYGIEEERMRILVGHCINNATEELNVDMLKRMASYEKSEITHEPRNKYDLPPVLFLENIQGGVSVTQVDKRLLESLMTKMHFSCEVINVLVEYVLKINENRLTRSFVEAVASTWLRNKVTTVEDALKMTENQPVVRQVRKQTRKAAMPEYMEKTQFVNTMSEEERQQLLKQLNQLEE